MTILLLILAVFLQIAAMWCAAQAWDEYGLAYPNKKRRNRLIFGMVVLAVLTLATAAQL